MWPFSKKQSELEAQAVAVIEFARHLVDEMTDSIKLRESLASFPDEAMWRQIKRYFQAKGLDVTQLLDDKLYGP